MLAQDVQRRFSIVAHGVDLATLVDQETEKGWIALFRTEMQRGFSVSRFGSTVDSVLD